MKRRIEDCKKNCIDSATITYINDQSTLAIRLFILYYLYQATSVDNCNASLMDLGNYDQSM